MSFNPYASHCNKVPIWNWQPKIKIRGYVAGRTNIQNFTIGVWCLLFTSNLTVGEYVKETAIKARN